MSRRPGFSIISGLVTLFIILIVISIVLELLSNIWINFIVKYWFIAVPVFILILIGMGKLSEEEEARKEGIIRDLNKNKELIRNFASKYSHELSHGMYIDEEFNRFIDLLKSKGVKISESDTDDVRNLIMEELEDITYSSFKKKITHNKPRTKKEYLLNYIEAYGEYNTDIDYLYKLLADKFKDIESSTIVNELEKYRKEIELKKFEQKLTQADMETFHISDLDQLDGYEFEDFLQNLYTRLSYTVKNMQRSHEQGADLILTKFGEKIIVQAKRYSHSVGNSAIQEVTAAIKHYGADRGMVITTNYFTNSAIALALSNNIELIDRDKLVELIKRAY